MRLAPLLLLAALAACSGSSSEPSARTSDSGKTYDQLVSTYGPPHKMYDLVSGAQMVQYSASEAVTLPGGSLKEINCTARFWLYDKVVKTSTRDGDDAVCTRMLKGGRSVTGRQPGSNSQPNNILQPADQGMNSSMDSSSGDPPIDAAPKVWGDVPSY